MIKNELKTNYETNFTNTFIKLINDKIEDGRNTKDKEAIKKYLQKKEKKLKEENEELKEERA